MTRSTDRKRGNHAAHQPTDQQDLAAIRKRIRQSLESFNEIELDRVATAVQIVEVERGCLTPVEEFIQELLWLYEYTGGAITPDDVAGKLEEFRSHFADHMYAVSHYNRVFGAAPPAASRGPQQVGGVAA